MDRLSHAFLRAIQKGQGEKALQLLNRGADLKVVNGRKKNCLHLAADRNLASLMQKLLPRCSKDLLEQQDKDGSTALLCASIASPECALLLIAAGSNVKATDCGGYTALHWCCQEMQGLEAVKVATALLDAGAEVDATNGPGGVTPLLAACIPWACERKKQGVFELLVARGADIHSRGADGKPILQNSAHIGDEATIRCLVSLGADVNARRGCSLLTRDDGDEDEYSSDEDASDGDEEDGDGFHLGATPLMVACESIHHTRWQAKVQDTIMALIELGADTTAEAPVEFFSQADDFDGAIACALWSRIQEACSDPTPIEVNRRFLYWLTSSPTVLRWHAEGKLKALPAVSSAKERNAAIDARLVELRADAAKRRNHLAFARGAFTRGYRRWEAEDSKEEVSSGEAASAGAGVEPPAVPSSANVSAIMEVDSSNSFLANGTIQATAGVANSAVEKTPSELAHEILGRLQKRSVQKYDAASVHSASGELVAASLAFKEAEKAVEDKGRQLVEVRAAHKEFYFSLFLVSSSSTSGSEQDKMAMNQCLQRSEEEYLLAARDRAVSRLRLLAAQQALLEATQREQEMLEEL
jgi:Ankyrin repeats (3 copies)/Ankyrin repeat